MIERIVQRTLPQCRGSTSVHFERMQLQEFRTLCFGKGTQPKQRFPALGRNRMDKSKGLL